MFDFVGICSLFGYICPFENKPCFFFWRNRPNNNPSKLIDKLWKILHFTTHLFSVD